MINTLRNTPFLLVILWLVSHFLLTILPKLRSIPPSSCSSECDLTNDANVKWEERDKLDPLYRMHLQMYLETCVWYSSLLVYLVSCISCIQGLHTILQPVLSSVVTSSMFEVRSFYVRKICSCSKFWQISSWTFLNMVWNSMLKSFRMLEDWFLLDLTLNR